MDEVEAHEPKTAGPSEGFSVSLERTLVGTPYRQLLPLVLDLLVNTDHYTAFSRP